MNQTQQHQVGRQLRDQQLDMFELRDTEFLSRCRALGVEICRTSATGTVSINDIRALCPRPSGTHPSVYGSVFKGKAFRAVGYTEAVHPEAHARVVRVYALRLEA